MAVTDIVAAEAAAKEGWPADQMEKQIWDGHALLEKIEARNPIEVSQRGAVVAIQTGRGGGVTMVPSTGSSSLNEADGPKVSKGIWKLGRIRNAVEIDTAVFKETNGEPKSVTNFIDLAVEDNLSTMQLQLTRQLANDGKGYISQMATNTSATVLKLATTGEYGMGREAMRNGWLTPGQTIDIGTASEPTVIANGVKITAISASEEEPSITVASGVTTGATHFVSLHGSRSGSTSNEILGFRSLSSQTSTVGEINPSTVPTWKGGFQNTEGGAITRQKVIAGRRKAKTRGNGVLPDSAWTSPEQLEALENETFQQVRFDDPGKQELGDGENTQIGSLKIEALMDSPIGDFTYTNSKYLFCVRNDKPYWCTEEFGGSMFLAKPGSTFVYGDMEYFINLACTRRNTVSQYIGLEAPAF